MNGWVLKDAIVWWPFIGRGDIGEGMFLLYSEANTAFPASANSFHPGLLWGLNEQRHARLDAQLRLPLLSPCSATASFSLSLFFWGGAVAGCESCSIQTLSCGMWDPVPWLGIEPGPLALGARSLSHWTTREAPHHLFLILTTSQKDWDVLVLNKHFSLFVIPYLLAQSW